MLLQLDGTEFHVSIRWVDCYGDYVAVLLRTKSLNHDIILKYTKEPIPHWKVRVENSDEIAMIVGMDSELKSGLLSWVQGKDCNGFETVIALNSIEHA